MINNSIDILRQQDTLQQQSAPSPTSRPGVRETVAMAQDLRDKIANFDDLPADTQLLLLGATLFRHPDVRGAAVGVRRARRDRLS